MVVESVSVLGFRNLASFRGRARIRRQPPLGLERCGQDESARGHVHGAGRDGRAAPATTARRSRSASRSREPRRSSPTIATAARSSARSPAPTAGAIWSTAPRRPPRAPSSARRWRSSCPTGWRLIKGPPANRRNHLDGFWTALWPSRAETRRRYSRALAQRNALLGRIRAAARRRPPSTPGTPSLRRPGSS